MCFKRAPFPVLFRDLRDSRLLKPIAPSVKNRFTGCHPYPVRLPEIFRGSVAHFRPLSFGLALYFFASLLGTSTDELSLAAIAEVCNSNFKYFLEKILVCLPKQTRNQLVLTRSHGTVPGFRFRPFGFFGRVRSCCSKRVLGAGSSRWRNGRRVRSCCSKRALG